MRSRTANGLSVGIDEAGRGCVLGPLVVAVVAADGQDRRWFRDRNVRDSKVVPAKERDRLAHAIMERCWFAVRIAFPQDIDAAVRDRDRTLNGLELELMADLLRESMDAHADREMFALVDAPSINAQGFLEKLHVSSGWDDMERLRARHHADARDRTVGAASIVAKHHRERLLATLKKEIGCDVGSGYCHDERTIAHLKTVAQGATHVRWTWATAKRVILYEG